MIFYTFFTPCNQKYIYTFAQKINLIQTYKTSGYGEYQSKNQRKSQVDAKNAGRRRQSLYLEYYMGYNKVFDEKTGKEHIKHIRSKEFLGLYLLPNPRTPEERQQNKETLALAAEIRWTRRRC